MTSYGQQAGVTDKYERTEAAGRDRQLSTREGNEMDFLLTFTLVVLLIVVPVVAGMAMGYGLDDDDEH